MQEVTPNLKRLLQDFCLTDTKVREVASKILTEFEVYGSKGLMPPLENVVELLVLRIESLKI